MTTKSPRTRRWCPGRSARHRSSPRGYSPVITSISTTTYPSWSATSRARSWRVAGVNLTPNETVVVRKLPTQPPSAKRYANRGRKAYVADKLDVTANQLDKPAVRYRHGVYSQCAEAPGLGMPRRQLISRLIADLQRVLSALEPLN